MIIHTITNINTNNKGNPAIFVTFLKSSRALAVATYAVGHNSSKQKLSWGLSILSNGNINNKVPHKAALR